MNVWTVILIAVLVYVAFSVPLGIVLARVWKRHTDLLNDD